MGDGPAGEGSLRVRKNHRWTEVYSRPHAQHLRGVHRRVGRRGVRLRERQLGVVCALGGRHPEGGGPPDGEAGGPRPPEAGEARAQASPFPGSPPRAPAPLPCRDLPRALEGRDAAGPQAFAPGAGGLPAKQPSVLLRHSDRAGACRSALPGRTDPRGGWDGRGLVREPVRYELCRSDPVAPDSPIRGGSNPSGSDVCVRGGSENGSPDRGRRGERIFQGGRAHELWPYGRPVRQDAQTGPL